MPLYYVLFLATNTIPAVDMTEYDDIIYHVLHNDHAFQLENFFVHHIIDQLTTETEHFKWINSFLRNRNGQSAYNTLCAYYFVPAEGEKRVSVYRSNTSKTMKRMKVSFTSKSILQD